MRAATRAMRHRLVRLVIDGGVNTVWWTDAFDLDGILDSRLVALRRPGERWACESGGKWVDADFCATRFGSLPSWPDIDEPVEDDVDAATAEPLYIKYTPYKESGRWFDIERRAYDDDEYDDYEDDDRIGDDWEDAA